MEDRTERTRNRSLAWGGFLLGFALGGFFDGILLHQVLQWHHLLSGVAADGTVQHLRFQILADGLFHVAHYVFAVLGLWLVWSGRRSLGQGRRLVALALIGFGAWHIVDAVLSHWVLGIHRIRMDVDIPLLWDLIWVIPFGVVAVAVGLWMLRKDGGAGPGVWREKSAALSLILAVLVAGPLASLPAPGLAGDGLTLAVFRPGVSLAEIVAAADAVQGRLVWTDESEGVWLIALGPEARPVTLYRHGALLVSDGPIAAGCLSWTTL